MAELINVQATVISYAGVDLVTPSAEQAAWVERNFTLDGLHEFRVNREYDPAQQNGSASLLAGLSRQQGAAVSIWWPGAPFVPDMTGGQLAGRYNTPDWQSGLPNEGLSAGAGAFRTVQVGTLRWPSGAGRFATAHMLATTRMLELIYPQCYPRGNFGRAEIVNTPVGFRPKACPLILSGGETVIADLYLLPPRPLTGIPGALDGQLWLLTLVDERYYWRGLTPRNPAPVTGPGSQGANNYRFGLYRFSLMVLGNDGFLNYEAPHPDYPDLNHVSSCYPADVDMAVDQQGQRFVRFTSAGRCQNMRAQTSLTRLLANHRRYEAAGLLRAGGTVMADETDAGFTLRRDAAALLPVNFIYACGTAGTRAVLGTLDVSSTWRYVVPLATLFPGLTGTEQYRYLYDQLFLGADAAGNVLSEQVAVKLARRLAADWCLYQAAPVDAVYDGICNWDLEGLSDCVEWTVRQDECCTRVRRPPYDNTLYVKGYRHSIHTQLPGLFTERGWVELAALGWLDYFTDNVVVDICLKTAVLQGVTYTTVDNGVETEHIGNLTVVTDMALAKNQVTLPLAQFRPGDFTSLASQVRVGCGFKVPCCSGTLSPRWLLLKVLDFRGDCGCAMDRQLYLTPMPANYPYNHAFGWGGNLDLFGCDGANYGYTVDPVDPLGILPTPSPQPARLAVQFYCQSNAGLTGGSWVLRTSGCNGAQGGLDPAEWFYPNFLAPVVCNDTTIFVQTALFAVGACCLGQHSTQIDQNYIQLAITNVV